MKIKTFIIFLITLSILQIPANAAFLSKNKAPQANIQTNIGNEIQKEEFPDSADVEPKISGERETLVIKGSVEEVMDVNLDECLKYALGNNPRIQAALQDVFASDARIKQAWSNYFTQFSWQTGYTRIKQLQLSDALGKNLIFNYYLLGQITASQLLYDFGVTQNQVTIRKLDNKGYKIMLTGTVNEVVCEVKKAYYNLQYAIEAK